MAINTNTPTVKAQAAVIRQRALLALTPRRKALDRYYGFGELFDQRTDFDLWLIHRAFRQAALSGRVNPSIVLHLRAMTAYKYAELLAWLLLNRATWVSQDCEINMDDLARLLNRSMN